MTGGGGARRGWCRRLLVIVTALAASGCGQRDDIFHGAAYGEGGAAIVAASLMPSCACMTLRNRRQSPTLVVARFYGEEVGKLTIPERQQARVRFDWAGPNNEEVYEIVAFEVKGGERGAQLPAPLRDHLEIVGEIVPSSCSDDISCTFTTLNMNRAWSSGIAQEQVATHPRGVSFTRGGQTIDAAASIGSCGCMMLRNPTNAAVQLTARLRGVETGVLVIGAGEDARVAFDAGGMLPNDVYVIEAQAIEPMRDNDGGTLPRTVAPAVVSPGQAAAATVAIKDHITILGQMDLMQCDRNGLYIPGGGSFTEIDTQRTTCPFDSLGLNKLNNRPMMEEVERKTP